MNPPSTFLLFLWISLTATVWALPTTVQRNGSGSGKIVGGEDAFEGQFPYMMSIQYQGSHICGASLISNTVAVTSANCLYGYRASELQLIAGKHHITSPGPHEQKREVMEVVPHELFSFLSFENDIALVRINWSNPFVFNDYVSPVALPYPMDETTEYVVVSGWGHTTDAGDNATVLQWVQLPTIPDLECTNAYWPDSILDYNLCFGFIEGGRKDTCLGDNGSPLVAIGGRYLAGIVSWGYASCGRPNPTVSTQVSHFVNWISMNLKSVDK